jgi:4'-phosphopantetheinyl transferase EntD
MLFRPLLPDAVRLAEMSPADADPARLLPAEGLLVERAVEKRRREFAAGRILARDVFASMRLSVAQISGPLSSDADRVPIWPEGVVGSITHCQSLCATAAAFATDSAGIGLDVEPARPLTDELRPMIVHDREFALFDRLPAEVRPLGGVLAFAMKEAVYKAIYPIRRRFLEFRDVEIVRHEIRATSSNSDDLQGEFEIEVLRTDAVLPEHPSISGRYRIANGHVAAAVVLPPR